jgi:photosystem II stability/assembly factor-like uncharacterized protein
MLRRLAISASIVGTGLLTTSCVEQECVIEDFDLALTEFADDYEAAEGLVFCDPDQGPCVGAGGAIAFLPEAVSIDSPTEEDLNGAATGRWTDPRYFAVGDAGTLLTSDSGLSDWRVEEIDTEVDLWSVAALVSQPHVVAVGDGVAVRSRDAGSTWDVLALPEGVQITHLARLAEDTILAAGPDGRLWTTLDGETWSPETSPTTDAVTALYVAYGTPLLADSAGRVFARDSQGEWLEQDVPGAAPVVSFTGHVMVWALRSDGVLAYHFADEDWKRSDYDSDDAALMAASEWAGYYVDASYDYYAFYDWGWLQSVCVVDDDGEVHSASAWLEPVLVCDV